MLTIKIPAVEQYDEKTNLFINLKEEVLHLEHSLVSISKWESKWCKPFLAKEDQTVEETLDYIKCMSLRVIDDDIYKFITNEDINKVKQYIYAPMTATKFSNKDQPKNREIITSELIYYWMTILNIPFECERWHLNRLLTLINVCNIKSQPAKKMSKKEIAQRNAAVNAQRKAAMKSGG